MTNVPTAQELGLLSCRRCARVWPTEQFLCGRCGARLKASRNHLIQVWGWWAAALVAYVPANLWPMLETCILFRTSADPILVGSWKLASHGAWQIAIVIVIASVIIPLAKFAAIAALALALSGSVKIAPRRLNQLYSLVAFIGRWSMVDVFVVAILSSVVQFSILASVTPGPAALAFAISVIFLMISAHKIDSREIWKENAQHFDSDSRAS